MKKNTIHLHHEIFNRETLAIWRKLIVFKEKGVLGGGTALALQAGHRKSYDFDIFIEREIDSNLLLDVNKVFEEKKIRPLVDQRNELSLILDNKTKITFFYFPFPELHSLVKTKSLFLFSLKDLASNKAYAIGRRGIWKDYVDLYWLIIKKGLDIKIIVREAKKRFEGNFSEKLFYQQLVYWEDIESFEIEYLKAPIKSEAIQQFFKERVKKIV